MRDSQAYATTSHDEVSASLQASRALVKASDPQLRGLAASNLGAFMSDPATAAAGGLIAKLLPAGIGAALMVAVDPPANKRELFARLFVAFAASYLFGDVLFDFLHSFSLLAFLDHAKRAHVVGIDGLMGAVGWSVLGGASMWLKKFRADPVAAVKDAKS